MSKGTKIRDILSDQSKDVIVKLDLIEAMVANPRKGSVQAEVKQVLRDGSLGACEQLDKLEEMLCQ